MTITTAGELVEIERERCKWIVELFRHYRVNADGDELDQVLGEIIEMIESGTDFHEG